jgi:cyclohexadieny/prephenate dehydrogenase
VSSTQPLFDRVAIIGIGLIGSSLALALRQSGLAGSIVCGDASEQHVKMAMELELVDEAMTDNAQAVRDADLVILSTPVGTLGGVAESIGPHLKKGCIVIDVGSVKQAVISAVAPHIPANAFYIPCHPIAGTEESGPEAGFAELFQERWCLLTPLPGTDEAALDKVRQVWRKCGAKVEVMEPATHDRVLAMVSHLPHGVAFTAIGAADALAGDLKQEVIRYAGSSFRDFTRVAASDPIMWRDIFLNNREAVLDILRRFKTDLAALEQEIVRGDGAALERRFEHGRALRRGVTGGRFVEPPVLKDAGK